MTNAPISVIITTYNDYEYLDQAIKSVMEQELRPAELIVIDDGSAMQTPESITNNYIDNEGFIKVLFYKKSNGGASSARNLGLEKASQKYITFLDVDDKMLPNNLHEKYKSIIGLDHTYFGVYGGAIRSTGEVEKFNDFDGIPNPELIDDRNNGVHGAVWAYLFNKEVLKEVGGFDESLECNEDYDLLIRLANLNKKCKGCTGVNYYRNMRQNSLSRPVDPFKLFSREMTFLHKAEINNYYSGAYLNKRKMTTHLFYVKGLIGQKKIIRAYKYARRGFQYSNPITNKQKIIYYATMSFIK